MSSRSLRSVVPFITVVLMLFGLASGCVSNQTIDDSMVTTINSIDTANGEISFTEEEVTTILDEIMSGDTSTVDAFTEEELEAFVDALQEYGIYPDLGGEDDEPTPPPSGLPICSGYWGSYAYAETIEQRNTSSGLLYQVGANCYMAAPGSDCGTDYDDYMLSFYFGNHAESASSLKGMLRWTSSSSVVRALLGNMSGRLYEETAGGGRDNYNVYLCVDDWFGGYLETFKLRKY